jgi:CheY-like chemotaxis protein
MPAKATLTPQNQPHPPLRVLIVDDDELDRFVIRRSFNTINAPLELIEVADPREAVQSIKDLQPDVTLLDIQMPNMNGFEVLQALAEDQPPIESKVVMLSSSAYPEDEKKALKLGAQTYRTKPSTLDAYVKLAEDIHRTFGPGKAA